MADLAFFGLSFFDNHIQVGGDRLTSSMPSVHRRRTFGAVKETTTSGPLFRNSLCAAGGKEEIMEEGFGELAFSWKFSFGVSCDQISWVQRDV